MTNFDDRRYDPDLQWFQMVLTLTADCDHSDGCLGAFLWTIDGVVWTCVEHRNDHSGR